MRLVPRSLKGQMLLAIALALLLAQVFSAVLLYRAQAERREAAMVHSAAMRLFGAARESGTGTHEPGGASGSRQAALPEMPDGPHGFHVEHSATSPLHPGETRDADAELDLQGLLTDQNIAVDEVIVVRRAVEDDAATLRRLRRRPALLGEAPQFSARHLLVAGIRRPGLPEWLVVRVVVPPYERTLIATLIGQTILIYLLIVGAIALLMRRITRPLAALTMRLEQFSQSRSGNGQMQPEGPEDVRRLIAAHNTMECRIGALLDEKDVMLGAIGHDLKTPLAALRVRLETVEDEAERAKMAGTIEDIVRTLDDILALARIGKSAEPREVSELSALVGSVVEEYEDLGEQVSLDESARLAVPLRANLLRRALRNLIGNALRYGGQARVCLAREAGWAIVRIDDHGPGIPDEEIAAMMEPFARGEPSRNSQTGGTGLGLALARAIADQHGGTLSLANRRDGAGAVTGLTATLKLPLG